MVFGRPRQNRFRQIERCPPDAVFHAQPGALFSQEFHNRIVSAKNRSMQCGVPVVVPVVNIVTLRIGQFHGFQHVGFTQGGLWVFQLLEDAMPAPLPLWETRAA